MGKRGVSLTFNFLIFQDFERVRAFQYLSDIKNRFEQTYGRARIQDALPYGMNSDFSPLLASEMVIRLLIGVLEGVRISN